MWRIVATILCIFAIWLVFWLEGDDKRNQKTFGYIKKYDNNHQKV